jgi:hypothetical protein
MGSMVLDRFLVFLYPWSSLITHSWLPISLSSPRGVHIMCDMSIDSVLCVFKPS